MAGIIEALTVLHEKKLNHNDLKPENVIFDANGYPYLIDFGIACFLND